MDKLYIPIIIFLLLILIILITKLNNTINKLKIISQYNDELHKENEKILTEKSNLQSKIKYFESELLKFQLRPHTLNNILANIRVVSKNLSKGMDSLSDLLEYIYEEDKGLVLIEEEINFIEKYLGVKDIFISKINSIKLDKSNVNKDSLFFSVRVIPHLITANFIENAFKHGDTNHPEFLKIKISLNNDKFEYYVINRLKENSESVKHGIGYENMKKRMELLYPNRYEIKNSCNEKEYHSKLIINLKKENK